MLVGDGDEEPELDEDEEPELEALDDVRLSIIGREHCGCG